jgi:hypothetical protein
MTMWFVVFSEPSPLSRVRDTKLAGTGFSRQRPGVRSADFGCRAASLAACSSGSMTPPPISSTSDLSMRAVAFPPGTHKLRRGSACSAMEAEYSSHEDPHWPQSCCAMAAIMRRLSGRPSASFMRSSSGIAGSCQGASSSSSEPGSCTAPAGAGVALASSERSPAKKPLSQARCSSLKGADSGMSGVAGGGDCMVMRFAPPPVG